MRPVRTLDEAITIILDETSEATPHTLTTSQVKVRVSELLGREVKDGSIGNALTRARRRAPTNGGVKVGVMAGDEGE